MKKEYVIVGRSLTADEFWLIHNPIKIKEVKTFPSIKKARIFADKYCDHPYIVANLDAWKRKTKIMSDKDLEK